MPLARKSKLWFLCPKPAELKGVQRGCFSSIHCHWQRIPPDFVKTHCGKFVWQLLAEGGRQGNYPIPTNTLRALVDSTETFRRHWWRWQSASKADYNSKDGLGEQLGRNEQRSIWFFFWVFCFINLQTSKQLFHFGNQISTWLSLPLTKQRMLSVCPQSLLHGPRLCPLFLVLIQEKKKNRAQKECFWWCASPRRAQTTLIYALSVLTRNSYYCGYLHTGTKGSFSGENSAAALLEGVNFWNRVKEKEKTINRLITGGSDKLWLCWGQPCPRDFKDGPKVQPMDSVRGNTERFVGSQSARLCLAVAGDLSCTAAPPAGAGPVVLTHLWCYFEKRIFLNAPCGDCILILGCSTVLGWKYGERVFTPQHSHPKCNSLSFIHNQGPALPMLILWEVLQNHLLCSLFFNWLDTCEKAKQPVSEPCAGLQTCLPSQQPTCLPGQSPAIHIGR